MSEISKNKLPKKLHTEQLPELAGWGGFFAGVVAVSGTAALGREVYRKRHATITLAEAMHNPRFDTEKKQGLARITALLLVRSDVLSEDLEDQFVPQRDSKQARRNASTNRWAFKYLCDHKLIVKYQTNQGFDVYSSSPEMYEDTTSAADEHEQTDYAATRTFPRTYASSFFLILKELQALNYDIHEGKVVPYTPPPIIPLQPGSFDLGQAVDHHA